MSTKAYTVGKRKRLLVFMMLAAALLAAAGITLREGHVICDALDGRREIHSHVHLSQFALREQMYMEQAGARVRGWQSIAGMQEIWLSSPRGRLFAALYDPIGVQTDAPWALVFHGGLGTDHTQVLDVACALSLEGYRVLAPDLYAHGRSNGEIASLGLMDAQDVRAWIDWILLEDMDARIVVYGIDEGAVASLIAAGDGLPDCVDAVAADSAYVSVQARAHELLSGLAAGRFAKYLLDPIYRIAHGEDIMKGDVAKRISGVACPILVLHGTGDEEVLAWQGEDIANAAGQHAQLLLVEGAGHGRSRFLEPQTYYDALLAFYRENLNGATVL